MRVIAGGGDCAHPLVALDLQDVLPTAEALIRRWFRRRPATGFDSRPLPAVRPTGGPRRRVERVALANSSVPASFGT